MCQCGCSDIPIEEAYSLPGGAVIGVGIYRGCADCHQGLAVDISVFDNRKSEWLSGAKITVIKAHN